MQRKNTPSTYLNNPNLKAAGVQVEFTMSQIEEYSKCKKDPIYFIENYCKIVSLDRGVVLMKLYEYQKRILSSITNNRNTLVKLFRQAGKSQVVSAYLTWVCTFSDKPENIALLANKLMAAKEIFSRVQFTIEELPKWMQQGVVEWNKTSFELENKVKCFAAASSPSSVRSKSISILILDEFAFLRSNVAEEFMASVFPTVSSSKTSKMIIVSTPKGMNHYWKLWTEAKEGINNFSAVEGHWKEHPDRDQAWADDMLKQLGEVKYNQEIEASFIGSEHTLISGSKISSLPIKQPISQTDHLKIYENPSNLRQYVTLVDVARGLGNDYSVASIIDISEIPYKLVAIYRCNTVSTMVFPEIIAKISKIYNNSFVLIETNDLGQQVADILYYDLEYENVYMSSREDIAEGGKSFSPGIRTTKKTKSVGCNTLKSLVENDQLLFNDSELITEASNFIRQGASFKADDGKTDDIMMTMVIFAYLTTQPVFKDLFDYDLRSRLIQNQMKDLEESMLPVGFHSNDYFDEADAGWENYSPSGNGMWS